MLVRSLNVNQVLSGTIGAQIEQYEGWKIMSEFVVVHIARSNSYIDLPYVRKGLQCLPQCFGLGLLAWQERSTTHTSELAYLQCHNSISAKSIDLVPCIVIQNWDDAIRVEYSCHR